MIIGQNLYSNANFQRTNGRKVGFGMKIDRNKIKGYADSLGRKISKTEAREKAKREIQNLERQLAIKFDQSVAERVAFLKNALKEGLIHGG